MRLLRRSRGPKIPAGCPRVCSRNGDFCAMVAQVHETALAAAASGICHLRGRICVERNAACGTGAHRVTGNSMKALCWHGKNDIRCDTVPDPVIEEPRDAIIKVSSCAICG